MPRELSRLVCGLSARSDSAARAGEAGGLDDGEDALSLIFVSTLPWLYYTDLRQPTPRPADSNPRVTWGKYRMQNGAATMPVTLLAHHALVDGVHIDRFL